MEAEHQAEPFARRWRHALLSPMDLLVLPVAVTMWLLQQAGFVADVPPWIFAILLLVASFCTSIVYTLWPDEHCTYSQMSVRVGTEVSVISLIIYTCGWGPTLAIGYAFASANAIRASGSRAMKPAIFWCVSCIVMGQLMIVIGVAPTLISQPLVHGLAVLSGLGTVIVIWFQGWAAVQKETLEETVRNQEVRFEALVQHASDIITVFDLEGSILYARPSFDRVLGYRPGPSVKLGRDLLHPDDIPHAAAFFKDVQANPSEVSWIEVRMRDRDGGWIWFEIGVTNLLDDPSVGGRIANMRAITERKLVEEQLSFQAYHDELTRLPNRSAFLERLKLSLDRARLTTARSRCCSPTSTGSSWSTTASATRSATTCSWRSPVASRSASGPATSSRASAATSSPCCWRTSRLRPTRCELPTESRRRCGRRSPSTATSSS